MKQEQGHPINPAKAISDFIESIHLKPDFADAFFKRGLSFHSLTDTLLAVSTRILEYGV
jgi:hypothetical protein